jgi:hypothetical protein
MRYYYTDSQNQPQGPVDLKELTRLSLAQALPPDCQVCAEGAQVWLPISQLGIGPAPSAPDSAHRALPLIAGMPAAGCNWILTTTRRLLPESRLRALFLWFARAGSFLFLLGAVLTLIWSIIAAIRLNNAALLGTGLVAVLVLAILQFVSQRFLAAGQELVANSPTGVNSTAMMDSLGLLLFVAAFGALAAGIVAAIRGNDLSALIGGAASAVGLIALSAICLSPGIVNVNVRKSSAGEEAMGLLSFFLKANLLTVPIVYFIFGVLGCLLVLASLFVPLPTGEALGGVLPNAVANVLGSSVGASFLVVGGLAPMIAYFWFLLLYLFVDVIQAIVSLPGRLGGPRA